MNNNYFGYFKNILNITFIVLTKSVDFECKTDRINNK